MQIDLTKIVSSTFRQISVDQLIEANGPRLIEKWTDELEKTDFWRNIIKPHLEGTIHKHCTSGWQVAGTVEQINKLKTETTMCGVILEIPEEVRRKCEAYRARKASEQTVQPHDVPGAELDDSGDTMFGRPQ